MLPERPQPVEKEALPPKATPNKGSAAAKPTRPAGRWWSRLGQVALIVVTAALRLWHVDQNGNGNAYYAAGVRSMMESWHNFLYNSFDPGGFVSIDKPPVALWVQVASARLFGYSGLSLLVPQVLEGVAAVLLLYHVVGRRFGAGAGLLAGLFLALTPINVAVDRTNLTDSCLVLVLLLSAWALIKAAEKGSWLLLMLAVTLVGVGFNVKMLAACVVLPTFYVVYFLAAPVIWRSRIGDLTLASVVVAVVALSWPVAFDLTPPEQRPFAGSTQENSMLELTIGHNGLQRFVRRGRFPGGREPNPVVAFPGAGLFGGNSPPTGQPSPSDGPPGAGPGFAGGRGGPLGFGGNAPLGPLRLASPHLAAQMGWLLPLAVIGLVVGVFRSRLTWTLGPIHLALLLWFGWALTYGVVYSWAGGIFHEYYLNTMGPPLSALAGIGVAGLWSCFRRGGWRTLLLPVALLLTAAWQVYIQRDYLGWTLSADLLRSPSALVDAVKAHPEWRTWLLLGLVGGSVLAVLGLVVPRLRASWRRVANVVTPAALAVGLLTMLVTPTAWALSSVLVRGNAGLPVADLRRLTPGTDEDASQRFRGGFGGPPGGFRGIGGPRGGFGAFRAPRDNPKLVAFLRANHQGERFLLATASTQQAAPIIIDTGEAVMALGGFMGSDPILTPESFAQLVQDRQVRFVMVGGGRGPGGGWGGRGGFGPPGPAGDAEPQTVMEWVRKNGKPVDAALWQAPAPEGDAGNTPGRRRPGGGNRNFGRGPFGGGFPGRMGSGQLYDLRPQDGHVPAPAE
jgi:4-amino-4-deoxy-L-arabinose transferase-like glycosyltransferase